VIAIKPLAIAEHCWPSAGLRMLVRYLIHNNALNQRGDSMEELVLVLAGIVIYAVGLILLLDAIMPFHRVRITRFDEIAQY
jgi:hypothetical protein